MERILTLGITGRRPKYFPWGYNESDQRCVELKSILRGKIVEAIDEGYVRFASGVALGTDTYFSEEVLNLKKDYPQIELISYVPFPDQANYWNPEAKRRYKYILDNSQVVTISDHYSNRVFIDRDKRLVDDCDKILAVWDNLKNGGTWDTIEYAEVRGKIVDVIDYRRLSLN